MNSIIIIIKDIKFFYKINNFRAGGESNNNNDK